MAFECVVARSFAGDIYHDVCWRGNGYVGGIHGVKGFEDGRGRGCVF